MKRWEGNGEANGGRYFWVVDALIVRDASICNDPGSRRPGRER